MTVHILATCRKTELLPYTLLVFDTIRVGFPKNALTVHINKGLEYESIVKKALAVGAITKEDNICHHEWIYELLEKNREPFWICDTDVVFHDKVSNWEFNQSIAGRRSPEWNDEFTKCITRSRLHPSFMYINPKCLRENLEEYNSKLTPTEFAPPACLIYPLRHPLNGKTYFYDTMSLLYHAIGGQAFTPQQNDCFSHFHFGTISDLILPHLKDGEKMRDYRGLMLEHPELLKGSWRQQEEYYATHRN